MPCSRADEPLQAFGDVSPQVAANGQLDGGRPGTTFECLTRIGPFRTNDGMIVTEWEPGRVMGIEHRGLFTGTGRFTLEPVGRAQTCFTWTEEIHFPWWMAGPVGARGAQPILQRVWRANLERLARLVASRA